MSFLGFLHSYQTGDVISSSKLNDEFNQIMYALGYLDNNNGTANLQLSISGNNNSSPILGLDNMSTGDYLELSNGTLFSFFKNNGQVVLGANGIAGLVVVSQGKCPNLNADLLDSVSSAAIEQKVYSFEQYSVFMDEVDLLGVIAQEAFICPNGGATITKLKGRNPEIASADANTVITVYKNGVSIGTISIAGNTQAVQTTDIADEVLVENDVITFLPTTYTGTTKHKNVTAAIHYKKRHSL